MLCSAAAMPGGYRVLRLLSQSPHGRLYVAQAPGGGQVALKELVFSLVPEARQLEDFEREARLLRQVSHPRIPRFVDSFQEGSGVHTRLYLAQELIQGTSLRDLLRKRRLRDEEAFEVARQVLDVLRYLHELSPRIVHRDVKPANLVRRDDGAVFLVDFGAARDLFGSGTAGATMVGTFGYMPPEQLGGTLDETCDLYALGASLLHLLSGRSPEEMLASDLSLDVAAHAFVSPRMERFLLKLIARDPAERFRSALDAQLALESSSGDNQPVPLWRRATLPVLALGAVVAITVWAARPSARAPDAPPEASPPVTEPVKVEPPRPAPWEPHLPLLPDFPPHARWRFDEDDPVLRKTQGEDPTLTRLARDDQRRFDLATPVGMRDTGLRGSALRLGQSLTVEVVRDSASAGSEQPFVMEGLEEGSLSVWLRRNAFLDTLGTVVASKGTSGGGSPAGPHLELVVNGGHLEFSAEGSRWLKPRVRLAPDVFHHVVATWGKNGTRLYIGGRLVAEDPTPVLASRQGQTLWLGRNPLEPDASAPPRVSLDDLTLYRGVLPEEAVAALAALEQGSPGAAGEYTPEPPLFSEDFFRGLRRWEPQPLPEGVEQEFTLVEEAGNPHLSLFHAGPGTERGVFLVTQPREHGVYRASRLWLELDVQLTRNAPGAGLSLWMSFHMESSPGTKALFVELGSLPAQSALRGDTAVHFVPVRPGKWQHVKVELNELLVPFKAGPIRAVKSIAILGYGASVEGAIDNVTLVEE
ncbi:MAG TPA: protein kinase [Archangium sp.]|uniref:protein kinase domain-containing protein n=1 Tax=Archangium sp. TaxID=1872627 RepID=UPI002E3093EC|nr:protein kinase [Archangium sp.]HEX5751450.1 protein kinase [Archangium sp.]